MDLRQMLESRRGEILKLAQKYGARNVRIFGSVARGESQADSDIDILVDMEAGRSLLDHAALIDELEVLLGRKVDVATERGLKDRIRDRVIREAVPL